MRRSSRREAIQRPIMYSGALRRQQPPRNDEPKHFFCSAMETSMIIRTKEDVTPAVLAEIARADNPRFREIMSALVRHLHAFAREVKLTEAEYQAAAAYVAALGQRTTESHNEVILMGGALG